MNPEFWRDRTVFVTGHTGFKGSWLVLWLARLGARVCGYALEPPTQPSLFELASAGDGIESLLGDVRDRARLRAELLRVQPDIVLHLAAQSIVLHSYDDPVETYETNVVGTACVLDAVRQLRRNCVVVNVTTDKVYENRRWVWGYRENDDLGGRDPYSSSKACAELVARAFRASYFSSDAAASSRVGLGNARAGNVIGGGDWTARQLIPEAVAAMLAGKPVVLRHPAAIRPWQHVLDCLCGYLTLAEALAKDATRYSDDWNFGPSDADMQPVARVVEILAQHWGWQQPWVQDAGSYAHEELDLRLNSQKANRELQWTPRLALPDALAWTAEWYRRHAQGTSARDLCIEQIDRYAARAARAD